jgi:hypothetical protein
MPPSETLQHAQEYDAAVLKAAHLLVGITEATGDRFDEQLELPTTMGGLGLISAERVAPAAYIAGAEVALRLSPVFLPVWSGTVPLPSSSLLYLSLSDSLRRIHDTETALLRRCGDASSILASSLPLLPTSAAAFVSHFSCSSPLLLQSAITYRMTTLLHTARAIEAAEAGAKGVEVLAKMSSLSATKS